MTATSEFDDPRLAQLYDLEEGYRDDLEVYVDLIQELGARSVLDLGCGTGVLGHMLLEQGVRFVGVEPAAAMIDRARQAPGSARAEWIHGFMQDALPVTVEVVTMTANTAMVFPDDGQWVRTLQQCRAALGDGGHLVFEHRIREREAWKDWAGQSETNGAEAGANGLISSRTEVDRVERRQNVDLVTFSHIYDFADSPQLKATSTLAFRSRTAIEADLGAAGFEVVQVRDAPDRPGREWVFIARAV